MVDNGINKVWKRNVSKSIFKSLTFALVTLFLEMFSHDRSRKSENRGSTWSKKSILCCISKEDIGIIRNTYEKEACKKNMVQPSRVVVHTHTHKSSTKGKINKCIECVKMAGNCIYVFNVYISHFICLEGSSSPIILLFTWRFMSSYI